MVNHAQRAAIARETIQCYKEMLEHFPQMGTVSMLHTCEDAVNFREVADNGEQKLHPTIYEVCQLDSIHCAHDLLLEGLNPLVLNFASDFQPGGGWRKGSSAQEEDLFYKTTYGRSLDFNFNPATRPFYPLPSTACIYSPNVYVFRDDIYKMLEFEACYPLNFVACAAIRQPQLIEGNILIKPSRYACTTHNCSSFSNPEHARRWAHFLYSLGSSCSETDCNRIS